MMQEKHELRVENAIQITGLTKRFSPQIILNDLNLDVKTGECVGLVGCNGAGKTTLIKCLLNLLHVDSGRVTIFNQETKRSAAHSTLMYLPEKFSPPLYMSGLDFLHYLLKLQRITVDQQEIDCVVAAFDLDPAVLSQRINTYSKGMVQKLGLASCFICRKPLLVLDEPMSGLDPRARAYFKAALIQLKQQGGTVLMSTHMLIDTKTLCDRIIVLDQGKFKFIGTVEAFAERFAETDLDKAFMQCIMTE